MRCCRRIRAAALNRPRCCASPTPCGSTAAPARASNAILRHFSLRYSWFPNRELCSRTVSLGQSCESSGSDPKRSLCKATAKHNSSVSVLPLIAGDTSLGDLTRRCWARASSADAVRVGACWLPFLGWVQPGIACSVCISIPPIAGPCMPVLCPGNCPCTPIPSSSTLGRVCMCLIYQGSRWSQHGLQG